MRGASLPNPLNITSVQNAASNIVPGLPNAGIAQGAIFIIKGTGLGPANISIAPAAFQSTTLSGTSVAVTVGGTTVNAPMYYTSAAQVAALLPSNTPTGTGSVTVTYNGQTSATAPITVVANNLGIFTIDSSGSGPGIVTYADYSLVSAAKAANCGGPNTVCGAANPGDTLILWATGLGPVKGSDASGAGLGRWRKRSADAVAGRGPSPGELSGPIGLLHRRGSDCLHRAEQRPHWMRGAVGRSDWQ